MGAVEKNEKPRSVAAGDKLAEAQRIVRRNTIWAMGAGAVPIPFLDVLGIAAVQLRMVKDLCVVYGIDFHERQSKHIVASLMTSMGSVAVGTGVVGSLLKSVPLVGQTVGAAALAMTAGASVHAIGNVFVRHFEAKGTLVDFDPAEMRGYFRDEFEKAKSTLREVW
jgi:uncharacterized protein (DUF697 family)